MKWFRLLLQAPILTLVSSAAARMVVVTSTDGYVNVRSGPTTQHPVREIMQAGKAGVYLNSNGNWHLIKAPSGSTGYVYRDEVKIVDDKPPTPQAQVFYPRPKLKFSRAQVLEMGNDPDCIQQFKNVYSADYRKLVEQASAHQTSAMKTLAAADRLDGAAYDMHSETLWRLMHLWGDSRFSQFLVNSGGSKSRKLCASHLVNVDVPEPARYLKAYFPGVWNKIVSSAK